MIDRASIMAWAEHAPWTDFAMVEQDLIICRALVDIFSDDFLKNELAFRGGTALHKLYLHPQPRFKGVGLLKSEKIRFKFVFIYFINDGRKIANHLYAD